MPRLRDLDLARHLADPALKPKFVTPMFDLVAPRYDDFTRLFSFGMDARWKAELVRLALTHVAPASRRRLEAIDAGCGTGDIAFAVARARPDARVTGIDASREMLAFARIRARAGAGGRQAGGGGIPDTAGNVTPPGISGGDANTARVGFREGDLGALGLPDGSAGLVTAGYAYRNAAALAPAVAEAARVLRPGGVFASLDFYRPPNALWRALFLAYLRAAGNAVGWWWHGEPVAYGYIAQSIDAHVSAGEFSTLLAANGFELLACRPFLFGGVALHVARRRG